MQYVLKLFQNEDNDGLRVVDKDGQPWFVLSDVCRELEIVNVSDAASRLEADEKDNIGITDVIGRTRNTIIINESGFYSLTLTSRKESARRLKRFVTSEVLPSIRKTGGFNLKAVPAFIARYSENWNRVSAGHFSVLNELVIHLWGRLEHAGHIMADRSPKGSENRPDTSVGRCFSEWLKINHPEVCDNYGYYTHKTPEWEGDVREYPFSMLPLFREYLDDVWIPKRAEGYLRTRDPLSLPYLQKLLPPPRRASRKIAAPPKSRRA